MHSNERMYTTFRSVCKIVLVYLCQMLVNYKGTLRIARACAQMFKNQGKILKNKQNKHDISTKKLYKNMIKKTIFI